MRRYDTFVVRVLIDEYGSKYRGQISHAGTQKTVYFNDFDKAIAFIKQHLGDTTEQQPGSKSNGSTILPSGDQE